MVPGPFIYGAMGGSQELYRRFDDSAQRPGFL